MIKQAIPIPDAQKKRWLDRFVRFGLISKGVMYCLLGIIAVMAAAGLSNEKASKTGTLKLIYDQPFGKVVLIALLIGMLGYVTLRFFQCFKDSDQKGSDLKGLATRAGYGFSALMYTGVGIYIIKLLTNDASDSGNSNTFIVSKVLAWPGGQWIIGIIAVIIIGSGIRQIYKGASGKFMKNIALIRGNLEGIFRKSGMIGYMSRGVVLLIIGYLFFHASITSNPHETKGSEQAFAFIQNKFGTLLMAIVALGLVGYGVFMFVKSKYERLSVGR